MAITQVDYPVTGSLGTFQNIFPSQKELNVNFKRIDGTIDRIRSGTGGFAEIRIIGQYDQSLQEGDFVIWGSDSYSTRASRVITRSNNRNIIVDEVFTSGDTTNGFVNYRKNWFLEARFVDRDTPTDQQGEVLLLIDDFSQVPSSIEGEVSLDLSIVKDTLQPNLAIQTGITEGLSQVFKFQFRESYDTNRDGAWVSPSLAPYGDMELMLVIASQQPSFNGFSNSASEIKKFYKSYPTLFSYIYSDINDDGASLLKFNLSQYTLNKTLITTDEVASFNDVSSVINVLIPNSSIDENAVFLSMDVAIATNNAQYDPTQYDPAQYA